MTTFTRMPSGIINAAAVKENVIGKCNATPTSGIESERPVRSTSA
jgi:hypothetical protein